jgi:DNA sulfur modification protein DndC
MSKSSNKPSKSAFIDGFGAVVEAKKQQIRDLYLSDQIPWVIGYSGGKDSTATLQLVWTAVSELESARRHKPIHVISTDTLVENPVVSLWVSKSLKRMQQASTDSGLEVFQPHRLTPELQDRYWVNLIGKGYPAPRPKFRWCTSRLKINPSNNFIKNVVRQNGEAILVLGTRKAESAARHANMKKYEASSTRELLSTHGQLDRSWVYTPIADWSNDDVWMYLTQVPNPWGHQNEDLLGMYQGATQDGECPLVVDTSTPSCGDSRFGCFVCTLVDKDKSMQAMIQNDSEKEWMLPLMDFRNKWLDIKDDRQHRDHRRMDGRLTWHNDRLVHGPYTQEYRQNLLRAVLEAQQAVHDLRKDDGDDLQIISFEELEEIRRIWVKDKHELEDSLPGIFEEATGTQYPGKPLSERQALGPDQLEELRQVCEERGDPDGVVFQTLRDLLATEHRFRTMARRTGLYDHLLRSLEKGRFHDASVAEDFERRRQAALRDVQSVADATEASE